ncbi:hypothetical protein BEP19_08095 [Ammoniphilus oxalaticus]|uniref:Uncharacterized protein n=1 Tax=Ammoniphilus oxalaticus TaxID=66863 RepID=A0A419SK84_9BACL|nr:hypothetical protein [Ammoniphilus oxalaticus]RKD24346.1 hypothetical protein BEP19_08095 [Ammoniphilus oxalaticus]
MKRKTFIRYVNNNPELKQWLVENEEWVAANPKAMKQLIDRWYAMSMKRGGNRTRLRRAGIGLNKKIQLPKMDLDMISNATQQLTRTLDMFENMKNIVGLFGLR